MKSFLLNVRITLASFLLKNSNYRIVKRSYFDERLDQLLLQNDFFFIQIGAHDGVRFDSLYEKITKKPIRGVVIEPIKKYYRRLKINYEDYKGVIALNLAIHPTKNEVELYHVDTENADELPKWSAGIGSFYEKHHHKTNISDKYIIKEKVACIPFMKMIEDSNISKIDLLQIDAEGFDYEILKSINFKRIKPLLIKYEYINLDTISQNASTKLLKKHGYIIFLEGEDAVGVLNANT